MPTIDQAILAFINIRTEIASRKKAFDASIAELKEKQSKIQAFADAKMTELGVDSLKSATCGTVFRKTTPLISIGDKSEYVAFVMERIEDEGVDGIYYMNIAASKSAVTDYMGSHENALPPGIKYDQKVEIQFRAPTKKK